MAGEVMKRAARKNVYWLLAISVLLAVVVYQETHRKRYRVEPESQVPRTAHEKVMVDIEVGKHSFREWAALWTKQTGVEITLLPPAEEGQEITSSKTADTQDELWARRCTLGEAVEDLAKLHQRGLAEMAVEFEKDRIVVGHKEFLESPARNVVVAYPIGDFLDADEPFAWPSTREGRFEQLKMLLRNGAMSEDWVGKIENVDVNRDYWCELAGDKMIIKAPPGMQWKVEQYLRMLRAK